MSYGGFSHGTARDRTEQALHDRRPFSRRGYAMSAIEGSVNTLFPANFGELPAEQVEQYKADKPVYTVLSYQTPIAWITSSGLVRIPEVKYSLTTTQHQRTCKYHLIEEGRS